MVYKFNYNYHARIRRRINKLAPTLKEYYIDIKI